MLLSSNQIERLADRVFRVLKASGHIYLDPNDERIEERVIDAIASVLEDDNKMEDRLTREAERLVKQQSHIAMASGRSFEELIQEVKTRLARSKKVLLDDGPDRADSLAEKIVKILWRIDGVDFFSEDKKVQNCIAHAIYRFRHEDDKLIDAVERVVSKKTQEEPYSPKWCQLFDKYWEEALQKIAQTAAHAKASQSKVSNTQAE